MVDFQGVMGAFVLLVFLAFLIYDWIHRWTNERRATKLKKGDGKNAV